MILDRIIKPAKVSVNYKLPEPLMREIKEIAKERGLTVTKVIIASLQEFRDEMRNRKKGSQARFDFVK